jgi:hypothetical protein
MSANRDICANDDKYLYLWLFLLVKVTSSGAVPVAGRVVAIAYKLAL